MMLTADARAEDDGVPIFDGQSLSGWVVRPTDEGQAGHWRVDAGVIVGENPNQAGSNLWTERVYRDYELLVEFKSSSEYYDTGVFVRGPSHQVQIGISGSLKRDMTACIYAPIDGAGGYPGKAEPSKIDEHNRAGEWNRLWIVVSGDRIRSFLNGQPMVDYRAVKMPEEGPIGLQLHAGHHMRVFFRGLVLRELDP